MQASLDDVKKELESEVVQAKLEASTAKEEFAAPTLIEGDNSSLEDTKVEVKKSSALSEFIKTTHNL